MRLKIGRIANIDVFLHWTYVLLPGYIVYKLKWQNDLPWNVVGILIVLLLAVSTCVLMHEYGHALMARRYGVATKDIIISPIGGLARLDRIPRKPIQEMMITLAGPAVNLAIALLFAIYILVTHGQWMPDIGTTGLGEFPALMMWANGCLFLFNLIPAFPMDGGRILRSGLAFMIPYHRATLIAGVLGQLAAILFSIYGIASGQYILSAIGVFVYFAARFETMQSRMATVE